MKNKVISIILCAVMLFGLSSCDSADAVVSVNTPTVIAVGTEESADYYAALDYTSTNGFELVEFQSRQSAILAVENEKADYVIINDKTATKEFLENTKLQWQQNVAYKIEYCAIFNKGEDSLKQSFDNAVEALNDRGVFKAIQDAHHQGEVYAVDEAVKTDGTITVICAPVFENALYNDDSGKIAGYEMSIIKAICNELSMEVELYACRDFEDMFEALEKGKGDVIISAVSYTDERATTYLLSEPYFQTEFGLYKRKY